MPSLSNNCGCSGGGSTTIVIPDVDELVKKTQNQTAVAGLTDFSGVLSTQDLVASGETNLQNTTIKDLTVTGTSTLGTTTTTNLLATDTITATKIYATTYENLPPVILDPLTLDATNHRVGINDTNPSEALDVVGNIATTGDVYVDGEIYAVRNIYSDQMVKAGTVYATTYQNLPAQPPASILPITVDPANNRVGINDTSPSEALDVSGNIVATGNIQAGGTVTAAVVYATNYLNLPVTPAPDVLPITLDNPNNRVGINKVVPVEALDITGNVRATGNIQALGTVSAETVSATTYLNLPALPSSTFLPLTLDQSNNRVGVNKATPSEALDVSGNVKTNGNITTDGTLTATTVYATNYLNLPSTPPQNLLPLTLNNLTNRVGINKTTPLEALDVVGNIDCTGDISTGGSITSTSANVLGTMTVDSVYATNVNATNYLNLPSITPQLLPITLDTANNRVGINDLNPSEALDVVGNIATTGNLTTDGTIYSVGRITTNGKIQCDGTINKVGSAGDSVSIGPHSTVTNQGGSSIGIGLFSGLENQGQQSVAIGGNAGKKNQGGTCVAIGNTAGEELQGIDGIAIGNQAGVYNQGSQSIAIGFQAGALNTQSNAIAIGNKAALNGQGTNSIAIGLYAGNENQQGSGIAIGSSAGKTGQQSFCIGIGENAGLSGQLYGAVSIGTNAGSYNQGNHAIAIGTSASPASQHSNSIYLNATGLELNSNGSSRCFIAPIRGVALGLGVGVMSYDGVSKELVFSTTGPTTGFSNRSEYFTNTSTWTCPEGLANSFTAIPLSGTITVAPGKTVRVECNPRSQKLVSTTTGLYQLVIAMAANGTLVAAIGQYPTQISSTSVINTLGNTFWSRVYTNFLTTNQTITIGMAVASATSVTAGAYQITATQLKVYVTPLD